jgi:cyclic pyranopterin phosphate synthase
MKKKKRAVTAKEVFDQFPHLDESGRARMVDVGSKSPSHRVAVAEAFVKMKPSTLALLRQGGLYKGDAMTVARVAGIAASKKTADLIPLAHPVPLSHVAIDLSFEPEKGGVHIEARTETNSVTGVELEALVAASTAAMAIYDMAKKHDRGMVIEGLQLLMKSGGRSGNFSREDPDVEIIKKRKLQKPKASKKKAAKKKQTNKKHGKNKAVAKKTAKVKSRKRATPKKKK